MTPETKLIKGAIALLSKRGAWGQGWFAMTKTGGPIRPTDPAACSFCVQGALIRQVYDLGPDHQEFFVFERARENVSERLKRILRSRETYTKNVAQWNDAKHRKKKEVIALLKEALSVKDETP